MSKIKLELTKRQLEAICTITDTISAMIGGSGTRFDTDMDKEVKLIDKMLNNNNYKRNFK